MRGLLGFEPIEKSQECQPNGRTFFSSLSAGASKDFEKIRSEMWYPGGAALHSQPNSYLMIARSGCGQLPAERATLCRRITGNSEVIEYPLQLPDCRPSRGYFVASTVATS